MPSIYLRRLLLEINEHIECLFIYTQDYQWPFHLFEGFSSEFFDNLHDLRAFHFYIRLITTDSFSKITSFFTDTKHLINRNLCHDVAYVLSKDIGQIFSLPFAFNHFEIFENNIFNQIQYSESRNENSKENYWNDVKHLTLNLNIYDPLLLKLIKEKFTKLQSIDYQVLHFSLIPQDNELHQYHIQLGEIIIVSGTRSRGM